MSNQIRKTYSIYVTVSTGLVQYGRYTNSGPQHAHFEMTEYEAANP